MTTATSHEDALKIIASVEPLPQQRPQPALVVLVGSPGAGKSTVAEALGERRPLVVLNSDRVRTLLLDEPDYSFTETQRVVRAMRLATGELLQRNMTVVLDANHLTEWERSPLYNLAELHHARLVLIEVTAPMNVVLERLDQLRARDEPPEAQESEAAADVYHRLADQQEPITREHHTVDTSKDIDQFIGALVLDLDED